MVVCVGMFEWHQRMAKKTGVPGQNRFYRAAAALSVHPLNANINILATTSAANIQLCLVSPMLTLLVVIILCGCVSRFVLFIRYTHTQNEHATRTKPSSATEYLIV